MNGWGLVCEQQVGGVWHGSSEGAVNGWGLVCEQQVGGVWHGSSEWVGLGV